MTGSEMPDNVRGAYLRAAQAQCPALTTVYEMGERSVHNHERRAVDQLFSYVAELLSRECDHMPGDRVPDDEDAGVA